MLGDLAGIGPVRDALVTTNTLLEQVLAELKRTNEQRLDTVAAELRTVNAGLAKLVEQGAPVGAGQAGHGAPSALAGGGRV